MSSTLVNNDGCNDDLRSISSSMETARTNLRSNEFSLVINDKVKEFSPTEGRLTSAPAHHGREENSVETASDATNSMKQPALNRIFDVHVQKNANLDDIPHRTISPVDSFLSLPDKLPPSARVSMYKSRGKFPLTPDYPFSR